MNEQMVNLENQVALNQFQKVFMIITMVVLMNL
jgi:hypothetical protein